MFTNAVFILKNSINIFEEHSGNSWVRKYCWCEVIIYGFVKNKIEVINRFVNIA